MTRSNLLKIFLLFSGCVLLTLLQQYVLVVGDVRCQYATQAPCPETIAAQLNGLHGMPLLFSDLESQAENLIGTEAATISKVYRELPSTVHIELAEAVYVYGIQTSGTSYVVTQANQLLARPVPENLIKVKFTDPAVVEPSTTQLQQVTSAITTLASSQLKFRSVLYSSAHELRIELQQPEITVIVNPSQIATQLSTVPLVIHSPEFLGLTEPVSELDMRFEMPVIRTKQVSE